MTTSTAVVSAEHAELVTVHLLDQRSSKIPHMRITRSTATGAKPFPPAVASSTYERLRAAASTTRLYVPKFSSVTITEGADLLRCDLPILIGLAVASGQLPIETLTPWWYGMLHPDGRIIGQDRTLREIIEQEVFL